MIVFESWNMSLPQDGLSMMLDLLLIVVMVGLWWLWWQQAKRQKKIEHQLLDAAEKLQAATLMLDEALRHIEHLQTHEQASEKKQSDVNPGTEPRQSAVQESYIASGDKNAYSPTGKTAVHKPVLIESKSSQAAQILRMQREGNSPEDIARSMNIPLAQVKLMLMLHKQND